MLEKENFYLGKGLFLLISFYFPCEKIDLGFGRDYSEAVHDFLYLLMDEVGSEHSEKRLHFIERVVNLGKGFFELSDGVLFLNIVKRVFDVEDLNADCVQQLFS